MVFDFLEVINDPDSYAVTRRNGELHVRQISDLTAQGITVHTLSSKFQTRGTPDGTESGTESTLELEGGTP